jgi:hypothetical protein
MDIINLREIDVLSRLEFVAVPICGHTPTKAEEDHSLRRDRKTIDLAELAQVIFSELNHHGVPPFDPLGLFEAEGL